MLSFRRLLPLALALVAGAARAEDPNELGPRPPGQFDFYVLSLTWVPGFCAGHSDPAECSLPTSFALHVITVTRPSSPICELTVANPPDNDLAFALVSP